MNKRIMVAQPVLGGNERKYVLDCLDTNWISSNGRYIGEFEQEFARFCNVEYAISANNGTTALHLALVGLGLQPGDEVLIPTVTYIATANAVRYCGATPVLVDVSEGNLNIDMSSAAKKLTPRTKGIIPVHLYGHPADMKAVMDFAEKHKLWVLEDAAEAHGAEAYGCKVGSIGTCATFSFFGNKIVTTGEGGMITTNDPQLAKRLRLFRGQGMDLERRYWFPVVGYNYRMTNIAAAIGLAQLERVQNAIEDRARIAAWYNTALAGLQNSILLPKQAPWAKQVFWMYNILLRKGDAARRDHVMTVMDRLGIETRPVFYPMHSMPPYFESNAYPVADTWSPRGINLPTHQALTQSDIERVAAALHVALQD